MSVIDNSRMNFSIEIEAYNEAIRERNRTLPEDQKEKLILTGRDAEKAIGIQHEFAAHMVLQTDALNSTALLRAGLPPMYDAIRAAKSGLILSKSSNHGMGRSLIPAIKIFSRLGDYQIPIGYDPKDEENLKAGKQPTVHLKHSLRDVLEMTKAPPEGDLKVVSLDNGKLILRYQEGCGPAGFEGSFVLNLNEANPPPQVKQYPRPWKKFSGPDKKFIDENTPSDIDISSLEPYLDYECPIYYKETDQTPEQPFMVFSDNESKPIVGDWDLFVVGHPVDAPLFATQVFNTLDAHSNQKEILKMMTELLFLVYKRRAMDRLNIEKGNIEKKSKESKFKKDLTEEDNFPKLPETLKEIELRMKDVMVQGEMKNWEVLKREVEKELRDENEKLKKEINENWKDLLEYLDLQKKYWSKKDKLDKLKEQKVRLEHPELENGKLKIELEAELAALESEMKEKEALPAVINAFNAFKRLNPVDRFFILAGGFNDIFHQESLDRAGRITPFVFLYNSMLNAAYADPETMYGAQVKFGKKNPFFDAYIKFLLQHGPEDLTPYAPSAIKEIFGVYKGMMFLTHNEDQLIHALMMTNFLKDRLFHISPGWNMEKWSKVLEAQEKLGQINLKEPKENRPEMVATVESYRDYQAVVWMEKERERAETATFRFFRFNFNLDKNKADILIRQLKNYQKIPDGITDLLVNYLSNEDNLRQHIDALQNFPGRLKDYHLPINKWGKVIEKMMTLQKAAEPRTLRGPTELFNDMQKSNNLYTQLNEYLKAHPLPLEVEAVVARKLEKNIKENIEQQLNFGQRSSIPAVLMKHYELEMRTKRGSSPRIPKVQI